MTADTRSPHRPLDMTCLGLTSEITDTFCVSRLTMVNHLQRLVDKLGIGGREQLAAR
jgi:DNA-binding CsgD family transcriptional regulator